MSSPAARVFRSMPGELSGRDEFPVFINAAQRQRVQRGLFAHDYEGEAKEACSGEDASNRMLLQHDTLASDPTRALAAVYDFIGESLDAHDFERIGVDATTRQSILPPDLFRRFKNDSFWRDPQLHPRGVRIA